MFRTQILKFENLSILKWGKYLINLGSHVALMLNLLNSVHLLNTEVLRQTHNEYPISRLRNGDH